MAKYGQEQILVLMLVFGLMLTPVAAGVSTKSNICLAADYDPDDSDPDEPGSPGLHRKAQASFADVAGYRQWAKRCLLPSSQFERSRHQYFMIDVRDPGAWQRNHLDQSINLPLNSIKSRAFLKKKILLISEGSNRVAMVHACKQLKESGYSSVRVLEGGLAALANHGNDSMKIKADQALYTMSPRSLYYESGWETWAVIDLSSRDSKKLDQYFDQIYSDQKYPSDDQLMTIVGKKSTGSGVDLTTSVIVIDQAGQAYKQFRRWYENIPTHIERDRIFYLQGGIEAFEEFARTQRVMLSKQELVLTRPRGCAK